MLERKEKFFHIQIGARTDVVSVDRLKPVFSDEHVSVALPPAHGRPVLQVPAPVLSPPEMLAPSYATTPVCRARRVPFQVPPSDPTCRNLYQAI